MPDFHTFLLFAFAALLLNISPGPDMLYVASRSAGQGLKAGIVSALGIGAGCLVHLFAAALGVSAVLTQSAEAFNVVKWAGALYLMYIGLQSVRSAGGRFVLNAGQPTLSLWALFRQGAITNVLNPKVALFFLAFLPQFVQPEKGNATAQIVGLGLWFNFSGTLVNILVAALFGRLGEWFARYPGFAKWQEKATGAVLLALGLRLALWENK